MNQIVEAVVNVDGTVRLLTDVQLSSPRRAIVTIFDDSPAIDHETSLLSEAALAHDWNRPEEDAAWSYLQSAKSS